MLYCCLMIFCLFVYLILLCMEIYMYMLFFRDLERRIVEAEMELTLAKSQGYLKGQLQQSGSSDRRLLAVIGVYTGFGSRLKRNVFRGSWMPRGLFGFWSEYNSSYKICLASRHLFYIFLLCYKGGQRPDLGRGRVG